MKKISSLLIALLCLVGCSNETRNENVSSNQNDEKMVSIEGKAFYEYNGVARLPNKDVSYFIFESTSYKIYEPAYSHEEWFDNDGNGELERVVVEEPEHFVGPLSYKVVENYVFVKYPDKDVYESLGEIKFNCEAILCDANHGLVTLAFLKNIADAKTNE